MSKLSHKRSSNTAHAPTKTPSGGRTKVEQSGEAVPRLPHERDQSSDSQKTKDGHPPEVGRQAHEDLKRGLIDTDQDLEANRIYSGKGGQ